MTTVATARTRPAGGKVLSKRSRQVWRTLHFVAMGIYLTGVLGSIALLLLSPAGSAPALRMWAHSLAGWFDFVLIIPGNVLTLITGIWLSWRTKWELGKHWWIFVKLVVNVGLMTFGALVLRTHAHSRAVHDATQSGDLSFLTSPDYLELRARYLWLTVAVAVVLIAVIWISVTKPWGKAPPGVGVAVGGVLGFTLGTMVSYALFRGPAGPWMLPLGAAGLIVGVGVQLWRRRARPAG